MILILSVKNSTAPSPVMSAPPPSPYLDRVPAKPPNEKGSLGTGMPTFTPSIAALNLSVNQFADPPLVVYTAAAFPNGLAASGCGRASERAKVERKGREINNANGSMQHEDEETKDNENGVQKPFRL